MAVDTPDNGMDRALVDTVRSFYAIFPPPDTPLLEGVDRQRVSARVRKAPGATVTPTFRVEITDGETETILDVPIPDTPITSEEWVTLDGLFDAAVLSSLSSGLTLRVINTTPTPEPALEIGSINWFHQSETLGYIPITGIIPITGKSTVTALADVIEVLPDGLIEIATSIRLVQPYSVGMRLVQPMAVGMYIDYEYMAQLRLYAGTVLTTAGG